jgi:hypothetical protein
MKRKSLFLAVIFFIFILNACKKDGNQPAPIVNNTQPKPLTTAQLVLGKWFVVKDSVQTLDSNTPIPNVGPQLSFNNGDFVVFNKDSTAAVSSLVAFDAFFTDYGATNVDSKLFVMPNTNPYLNFKYNVAAEYSIQPVLPTDSAKTVYTLKMQNNDPIGVGYGIKISTSNSLVLYHQEVIPTMLHDYTVNEYVYLSR